MTALSATAIAGSASAQMGGSMMPSRPMTNGSSSSDTTKVSQYEQKKIDKCKAMSSDPMMKDKTCAMMMKKHPDLMKGTQ